MGLFTSHYKCLDCGKTFTEDQTDEWLDDEGEEDEMGEQPCCPYCGSDNVVEK